MVLMFALLATFAVAAVLTPLFAAWARRRNLLDVPNARSSHSQPTPRTGGVAVVLSVLGGCALLQLTLPGAIGHATQIVLLCATSVAILGFADDVKSLPALVRLATHTALATVVVVSVGVPELPGPLNYTFVAVPLAIFWLVGFTNGYNFMDGIDGIAGGQAVIAGFGWAAISLVAGRQDASVLGLLLGAAAAGFLIHNWHPAKVFMGDVGSAFFGFMFGALPFLVPDAQWVDLLCGVLLVWPFLFDTTFTFIRRARRRENVLAAHRSHLYQRWVQAGRSHRHVATAYAGMALATAPAALYLAAAQGRAAVITMLIVAVAALLLWRNVVSEESAKNTSQDLSSHAPV